METYNKLKNNYIFYISTPARPKGKNRGDAVQNTIPNSAFHI